MIVPARICLPLLALIASGWGCGPADEGRPVVFAAASLAEALQEVAQGAVKDGGPRPVFSFDATSRLARQVIEGAPADLFISADVAWMDEVEKAGRLRPGTRKDLLGNGLVIAVPATAEAPSGLEVLRSSPPERLALAGENVPAGRYADAALKSTGLHSLMAPRLVRGHSVRSVLEWVARGDVPMAIVYASDAHAEPKVKVAFALPAKAHQPITYVAGAVQRDDQSAQRGSAARALLHYLDSDSARSIFADAGFTQPEKAP